MPGRLRVTARCFTEKNASQRAAMGLALGCWKFCLDRLFRARPLSPLRGCLHSLTLRTRIQNHFTVSCQNGDPMIPLQTGLE